MVERKGILVTLGVCSSIFDSNSPGLIHNVVGRRFREVSIAQDMGIGEDKQEDGRAKFITFDKSTA
jgi:hypothetical protein